MDGKTNWLPPAASDVVNNTVHHCEFGAHTNPGKVNTGAMRASCDARGRARGGQRQRQRASTTCRCRTQPPTQPVADRHYWLPEIACRPRRPLVMPSDPAVAHGRPDRRGRGRSIEPSVIVIAPWSL
jgi:hypothetical protein